MPAPLGSIGVLVVGRLPTLVTIHNRTDSISWAAQKSRTTRRELREVPPQHVCGGVQATKYRHEKHKKSQKNRSTHPENFLWLLVFFVAIKIFS
jgi:hypothetical protein